MPGSRAEVGSGRAARLVEVVQAEPVADVLRRDQRVPLRGRSSAVVADDVPADRARCVKGQFDPFFLVILVLLGSVVVDVLVIVGIPPTGREGATWPGGGQNLVVAEDLAEQIGPRILLCKTKLDRCLLYTSDAADDLLCV